MSDVSVGTSPMSAVLGEVVEGARRQKRLRVVIDDDDILTPTPPPLTQEPPRLPSVIFTSVFAHRLPLPPLPSALPAPPAPPAASIGAGDGGGTWRGVIHGEEDRLYNATPTQSSASGSPSQPTESSPCPFLSQVSRASSVIPSSEPPSGLSALSVSDFAAPPAVMDSAEQLVVEASTEPSLEQSTEVGGAQDAEQHIAQLSAGTATADSAKSAVGPVQEQATEATPVDADPAKAEPLPPAVRQRRSRAKPQPTMSQTMLSDSPTSPALSSSQPLSQRSHRAAAVVTWTCQWCTWPETALHHMSCDMCNRARGSRPAREVVDTRAGRRRRMGETEASESAVGQELPSQPQSQEMASTPPTSPSRSPPSSVPPSTLSASTPPAPFVPSSQPLTEPASSVTADNGVVQTSAATQPSPASTPATRARRGVRNRTPEVVAVPADSPVNAATPKSQRTTGKKRRRRRRLS